MKVPYSWLISYCDPGMNAGALAERLSMTGTEVERIGHNGPPEPDGFVVGRVVSAEQHPNADRLRVCEVDTGGDRPRTIVCGAPNVAAGQTVAVALPGAVMPDGTKLGKATVRGIESAGMILSEPEMQMSADGAGIAVIETEAAPGSSLADVLPVSESVLEVEVTPNRPDCFGIYGIAREVHAITGSPLEPEPWADDLRTDGEGAAGDYASVRVEAPELCPRFTARVFDGIEIGPSPLWLKARLSAAGQRPINSVVDITNYVMLLTGQPLHAFDLDKVPNGELIIRRAGDGETMTTLDGVERRFDSDAVLVCDREQPSGIAGIMGGQVSEVSETTTRVLLEAATWNGTNILATSGKLGLRSEASTRFEKQLHPDLAMRGQVVASKLLVELCGARMVPGTIDIDAGIPDPAPLALRVERVEELLGMAVDPELQITYLQRLGFEVMLDNGVLTVTVPADRREDVTREADLIEEVGRIHGIDEHLPTTLPSQAGSARGGLTRGQALRRRSEDLMRGFGFDEVVSWSFTAPETFERLLLSEGDPRRQPIRIHNPLSVEGSAMRTVLLAGLLDAASRNRAHGAGSLRLFESGRVYLRVDPPQRGGPEAGAFSGAVAAPVSEPHRIGALVVGRLTPSSWRGPTAEPEPEATVYELKGALEALSAGVGVEIDIEAADQPFLHPGRAASVLVAGKPAGWLGQVHPLVARAWDLPELAAFELDLAALIAAASTGRETFEDVTTYPAVHEDIAVVVPAEVEAAAVRLTVLEAGGELLRRAEIFDLYTGEQVDAGRKSLALRLEFLATDRTLTDAEVAERRAAITAAIEKIGGALRG